MIKPTDSPSPMEIDIGDISVDRIWDEWASGQSPREIADELCRSVKTIYPILTKLQKALCDGLVSGKGPEEIARETGLPPQTIFKILEKIEKSVIEVKRG